MTRTIPIVSFALSMAPVAVLALAPAPAMAQPADMAAHAKTLLDASYPADAPGAAVVVTQGGRVIFAGARGLADIEGTRPIAPDTVFRLGSIAKQFTAAVILQLVAERRIALDDPLSQFFPDWPQPGARATVRQLLNHASGLQDYTKIPGYMLSESTLRPNTTADLVAVMRSRPAVSEPGTRWEYNNGGYVMLGSIIEQVTGKPWHVAVVDRIARPLGLTTIAYAGDAPGPNRARGYAIASGQYRAAKGVHISVAGAAGGLVGSAGDLARWAQALHHGRVVSPALYREMIAPARLADGSSESYGFGLRLRQVRGRAAFVHGGAGRGVDTDSVYVPSADLFVAVLANTDDPQTDPSIVTRRLAAMALGEPVPDAVRADVAPSEVEPLFGLYGAGEGPPRRFFARDGKLIIARGDEESPVVASGGDRFFVGPDLLNWFVIARRPDGAHVMTVHRFEAATPDRAVRSGPAPAAFAVAPAVLQSYVGSYQTEVPLLTVALTDDDRLTIGPAGQPAMPMRPVSDTEFRIDGSPMRVVFHTGGGRTDRLTLYRGARELHGTRVTGPK